MNKITHNQYWLFAVLSGLIITAHATGAGFYMGGQVGQSNTHNTAEDVHTGGIPPIVNVSPSNTGLGARLFLGYSANPYVGMEGGYTYFAPSTYSIPNSSVCGDPSIQEHAFDVVGKGTFPIKNFGAYMKAGIAFTSSTSSGRLLDPNSSCHSQSTQRSIRPTVALGVSYDLTQNWVSDFSWTRIVGGGTFKNADLIALGISYHFVDARCGQFLC